VTHAELKTLLEAQAAAAETERGNALAKMRGAIFIRLAATSHNVPHGRLAELDELMRLAPVRFSRVLGEVGITFMPRHAVEFVAGAVSRLRPQEEGSDMYLPRGYREVLRR
jgi:hypothetical protein